MGDGLLTILIENAQENSNILLPTLQFIEVLISLCVYGRTLKSIM